MAGYATFESFTIGTSRVPADYAERRRSKSDAAAGGWSFRVLRCKSERHRLSVIKTRRIGPFGLFDFTDTTAVEADSARPLTKRFTRSGAAAGAMRVAATHTSPRQ
ncbi:MAG: hypothetical protein QOH79_3840 [Acidimicrobiaceae bacterium]